MTHDGGRNVDAAGHCRKCGADLSADAAFCGACGCPIDQGSGSGLQEEAAKPAAALAVFCLLTVVGVGALYLSSRETKVRRAVPGSPTAQARPDSPGGAVPAGHPNIELPQEVVELIDQLSAKAEAAPDDVDSWQRLARARYRAALLNPTYYTSAKQALDHLVELDPDNLEAIRTQGNIAYDRREYREAEKHFRRYLELDGDDPAVRTDLGSTILFLGEREAAKQLYRSVVQSHPDFPQAYVNLGIALHADGETEEAAKLFRRARDLATEPAQQRQIDRVIAASEGRLPPPQQEKTPGRASPVETTNVASNAASDFQNRVDAVLGSHRILGPRIVRIDWTQDARASVMLANFPMDKMPPVARNKFKATINEQISKLATEHAIAVDEVRLAFIDEATERVMDTFDGKEFVGAFDVPADGYP